MKFFYMLFMISGYCYAAQHNQVCFPLPPHSTLMFNINNNNSQTANAARINPHQMQPQSLVMSSSTWQEWFTHNLNYKRLLLGAVVLGGGALALKAWLMATSVDGSHAWSEWKTEIPLATLQSSDKHIARLLFEEIKKRYEHCQQDGGLLDPIMCFMNDVDKEKRHLGYVVSMHTWLATVPLSYIVPASLKNVTHLQEKIERLRCLKKLLITWLSEYKIEQAS